MIESGDIMKKVLVKYDELVPKAAELTIKETENRFNDLIPEQVSDAEEFMGKTTDAFLDHYEAVFRKNLHDLVLVSLNEQLNES
ncbi:hypothetical protein [Staphylococcus nepalensis]|uniref:hypothetical protein n=1 Tax=Staphylococcus nepalensis TaxID=214473 RepID=UPI002300F7A0|nr:hypothetical protein [Staphylococcus nepalensis]